MAGVGTRVLVYDAADGDLLHSLKGHKDAVFCVAYASNGKRFASGGADKTIIVWTDKAEGILKYHHNDTIQSLAYNPVTQQLASATASDFGLWSPEEKSVVKHKVGSRIICQSWTNDGLYLALGMYDGTVSIRDKAGAEKVTIQRSAPVWCLAWSPNREEQDTLAVGCWDSTLSFYQLSGAQTGKERYLDFDPCSISHFANGEFLCVGGTNKKAMLLTKEGNKLAEIGESQSWVWCVKQRPKQNYVAVGGEDGSITMHQVVFSTVHGLYHERYAYRDNMTDVIIQHLITKEKVRIKCRDYVKKIAVYKDRLAVQLPDRTIIYELTKDDIYDMHYRAATKISKPLECNLLVVTSQHIILCMEKRLQLLNFDGVKEREWALESVTRYIKVVGGPSGREGLVVGLRNGEVVKIFINNAFPIQLVKHPRSVRCLDISCCRTKLAVVDEDAVVTVYDLLTKEALFTGKNANSVAWNTEHPDMLCYSGNGTVCIKTGDFPVHKQKMQGFVVGFKSSKVFCLHYVSMQTLDIPQSSSLHNYVAKKDFKGALQTAHLGVTDLDWRHLATESLMNGALEVSRKAFVKLRDVKYIDLIDRLEVGKRAGVNQDLFLAEVLAYQGRFKDAAKMFAKAQAPEKAMEMFSDLRQFDEARKWAEDYASQAGSLGGRSVQDLVQRQAEWCEEVKDEKAACSMYIQARKFDKAMSLISKNGWSEELIEIVRLLDKSSAKLLNQAAQIFVGLGIYKYAQEAYQKLGDMKSLVALYVEHNKWEEAFAVTRSHPEYSDEVHLPYAGWLAMNDKFDEARKAYRDAGQPEQSIFVLEQLCHNAVLENNFADAGYYSYQLAIEALSKLGTSSGRTEDEVNRAKAGKFRDFYERAEIYYTYSFLYRSVTDAFSTTYRGTLFNMARYLIMKLANKEAPHAVKLLTVFQSVAKQAADMGAYKLARFAYNKLHSMRVPARWQQELDLASIVIRSKPYKDDEGLLPVCFRCGYTNPLVNNDGDVCVNCRAPFLRSIITFEPLPVVEFELEAGISHEKALEYLRQEPALGAAAEPPPRPAGYGNGPEADILRFDDPEDVVDGAQMEDPFARQMMTPNQPIVVDRRMLIDMQPHEVLVQNWGNAVVRKQYYRILDPDMPIILTPCGHLCEQDEYEMYMLEHGHAPFCRTAAGPAAA